MLPPLQDQRDRLARELSRSRSGAASGAAPAGSTRFRVPSIISRTALSSSSSSTRTKSSRQLHRIRCGSSKATRVASPSARVVHPVLERARRVPPRAVGRRAPPATGRRSPRCSLLHRLRRRCTRRRRRCRRPIGHDHDVDAPAPSRGSRASPSRRRRSDAARCRSGCSGSRARAASCSQCSRASSKSRPWTTSSAPSRAHRGELDRVRALGDADDRPHAEAAGGERDRLAVVAGRGGDHAPATLVVAQLETRLTPPRTLKAPIGRWFSCLTRRSRRRRARSARR